MWIISLFLLSCASWALDPNEKVSNVKIVKVLPDNVVILDHGLEDGIYKNDHAKFMQDDQGYTARAICLKSNANVSYWQLYRIPYAEAVSKDIQYSVVGIPQHEIPSSIAGIKDKELDFPEPDLKKTQDSGPNPFNIKRDLPEKLTERDLIHATGPEKKKLFLERAINQDQLKRDLKEYRLSLFASPFARQSINEGESLRYGFRGGNIASKYRLLTQFEQQQSKMKDPVTKDSVSTRSSNGQAQFIIHRLNPGMSSLSLVNYNSQRFSSLATPKSHWQYGPLGFTWHLLETKNWEYMDFSYIPLYDRRTTEIINTNGKTGLDSQNGLRHGMRLAFRNKINERVALENLLWVRPYQDLSSWEIEADNLNLVNDLKMIFNLSTNLYFDYNLVYQKDKLWKTLSNLPETNVINSLNLRYDMDL